MSIQKETHDITLIKASTILIKEDAYVYSCNINQPTSTTRH